ncbi:MAG TPA: hypothetical protein VK163_00360 [Opitutaceae bacterium]|nr:hypothetical protein [Opitutaceae bacterium]
MLPALNSLERLRDHALLGFRAVAGGTVLFYGAAELAAGEPAWRTLGAALGAGAEGAGAKLSGGAAATLLALGGAAVVAGVWTRWAAVMLAACAACAAALRWPAVQDGTLTSAAAFFYPATMVAAFGLLATLGGGRFGIDAVYRARQKRKRRRSSA